MVKEVNTSLVTVLTEGEGFILLVIGGRSGQREMGSLYCSAPGFP